METELNKVILSELKKLCDIDITPPVLRASTEFLVDQINADASAILDFIKQKDANTLYEIAHEISDDYYRESMGELVDPYTNGVVSNDSRLNACVELYTLAAAKGHVLAQCTLANLLNDPNIALYDKEKAENYYLMAIESDHPEAQYAYALALKPGDLAFLEDTPSKLDERWLEFCRLAAEQGHMHAQSELGQHFSRYNPGPRDPREAAKWYQMAAEAGDFWSTRESAELLFELAEDSDDDDDYALARHWGKKTLDVYCSRDESNQYPDEYSAIAAIGRNLHKMLVEGLGGDIDKKAADIYGKMYSELALRSIKHREDEEERRREVGYDLHQDHESYF